MKQIGVVIILSLLLMGCKSKKKKTYTEAEFFPVTSYIKGQVAQMDTSISSIIKIERSENNVSDTTYIQRSDFKNYAKEFIELPEISSDKLRDDYEVTHLYDDLLESFVFTYTTNEKEHSIKKQDVIVEPGEDGQSIIKTINIDKWTNSGDSVVQKNMLWEADKRFLIITKTEKQNQPEKIKILEVKWNNNPS